MSRPLPGDSPAGDRLAAERGATADRIRGLTADLAGMVAASADTNADDEHDPEGTTIAFERAQVAALLAQAHADLDELDAAEARLAGGSYGRCEACGAPIGAPRLATRPAARTCVRCVSTRSRR